MIRDRIVSYLEMSIIKLFCKSTWRLEEMKFEQASTVKQITFLMVLCFVFSITLFSIIYAHILIVSNQKDMDKKSVDTSLQQNTTKHEPWNAVYMMTSSNGNIFRVTGPLCCEFTGVRWIPRTKASDAELWCFL